MATIKVSAQITNDDTGQTTGQIALSRTTTDENEDGGILDITTTERQVTWPTDIGTPGYLYLENKDATNYVEVGFATLVYPIKLLAGDIAVMPLNSSETDMFLKANTATCMVAYRVLAR